MSFVLQISASLSHPESEAHLPSWLASWFALLTAVLFLALTIGGIAGRSIYAATMRKVASLAPPEAPP